MSVPETGQDPSAQHEHRGDALHGSGGENGGNVEHRQGTVAPLLRESLIVVALALLLSLIVKTWLLQAFYIPSGSMENTLLLGDRVIVNKLVPAPISLRRGDVVVFEDPNHWLPPPIPVERSAVPKAINATLTFVGLLPSDEGNHLIKRVIGLPGDHVVCCSNKQLTVNGVPLTEPYLFPGDDPSREPFNIRVPAGRLWVMGDHRSDSADSRPHDEGSGGSKGSVPESLVVGRAITVVWPLNHWSWLANPSETFAKVPTARAK
jgi:signal peptidase I